MARRLITVEEFERMSPAERDAAFTASIVWDLDEVPSEFLARIRARVEERIAAEAEVI